MLGSKLMFVDIERNDARLQAMVELKKLAGAESLADVFRTFRHTVRTGDWICR